VLAPWLEFESGKLIAVATFFLDLFLFRCAFLITPDQAVLLDL